MLFAFIEKKKSATVLKIPGLAGTQITVLFKHWMPL